MSYKINCLSFFDGMSCGMLALMLAELEINQYFACEIDPYATKVSRHNFPDIIRLGNVKDIHYLNTGLCTQRTSGSWLDIPNSLIDLFIGGSPCQDLRPGRDGLKGKKSILFYEYLRMLRQIQKQNPEVKFLFENVMKISKDDKQIITDLLGVEPIRLNANLVSAQNRDRYYWTNIEGIIIPNDSQLFLKDILEPENNIDKKYYLSETMINGFKKRLENYKKRGVGFSHNLCTGNDKSPCLQARYYKDGKECIIDCGDKWRKLTPLEFERLQCVPDNFTSIVSDTQRYQMLGNGWNIKIIAHILKFYKK